MAEENSTGNNLIWAITTLIVVAIIAGVLYYSGFLGGAAKGSLAPKESTTINVESR
jgi:hypothetical protein